MSEQELQNVGSESQEATENVSVEDIGNTESNNELSFEDALSETLDEKENTNEPFTEPNGEPKKELEFDWTKDGRYKEMWKTDPNNMFRSYKEAEKQLSEYKPYKTELENLKSRLVNQGIDLNNLDNYIKEYHELKSPDNPRNQDLEFMYKFLNNPEHSDKVANFFRELSLADLQARFPNMNQEQIQRQIQFENELKTLKDERERDKQERYQQEFQKRQESGVKRIKEYADKRGFSMNDEQLSRFVETAIKENITPENYHAHFIYIFDKELDESYNRKMEESYLKRLNNNKKAMIPNSKSINSSNASINDKSLEQALNDIL
jgi:hypothetical protein